MAKNRRDNDSPDTVQRPGGAKPGQQGKRQDERPAPRFGGWTERLGGWRKWLGGWTERRAWLVFAIYFVCAAYLGLKGLGAAAFWDDEAQAVIIARNLVTTGDLTGWDGRNLMAYRNGGTLRDDFRPVNPPLDMLWAALGFRLFGFSTWAGRFPFVVTGLLAFVVWALILRRDVGTKDPAMWIYGLGLFCLSVGFILFIRNCRYYAQIFLFSLAAYYFYRRYLDSRRIRELHLMAASFALAFIANPMLCVAFLSGLCVTHLVFRPRLFGRKDWANVAMATAVFFALALPYALSSRIWERPDFADIPKEPWASHRLRLLWWNLRDLSKIPALPVPFLLGAVAIYIKFRGREPRAVVMAEWATLGLANVIFVVLLSPQPTKAATVADTRYLIGSYAFLWAVQAVVLAYAARWNQVSAAALFIVLLSCNVLSLTPFNTFRRWTLPAYLSEIHHPYPTACEAVVRYLDKNAAQDDRVFAWPSFMNYPLMFYLGERVKFCCLLDKQTHLPESAVRSLDAPLYIDENYPDWFIAFGATSSTGETAKQYMQTHFERAHFEDGKRIKYNYDPMVNASIYCGQAQRPELPLHWFGPFRDPNPDKNVVFIFRKRTLPEAR